MSRAFSSAVQITVREVFGRNTCVHRATIKTHLYFCRFQWAGKAACMSSQSNDILADHETHSDHAYNMQPISSLCLQLCIHRKQTRLFLISHVSALFLITYSNNSSTRCKIKHMQSGSKAKQQHRVFPPPWKSVFDLNFWGVWIFDLSTGLHTVFLFFLTFLTYPTRLAVWLLFCNRREAGIILGMLSVW